MAEIPSHGSLKHECPWLWSTVMVYEMSTSTASLGLLLISQDKSESSQEQPDSRSTRASITLLSFKKYGKKCLTVFVYVCRGGYVSGEVDQYWNAKSFNDSLEQERGKKNKN